MRKIPITLNFDQWKEFSMCLHKAIVFADDELLDRKIDKKSRIMLKILAIHLDEIKIKVDVIIAKRKPSATLNLIDRHSLALQCCYVELYLQGDNQYFSVLLVNKIITPIDKAL